MLRHSQRQWGRGAGLLPVGYVHLHPEDATRGQPAAIVTPDGTERPGAWGHAPVMAPHSQDVQWWLTQTRTQFPYPGGTVVFRL
jgi:hypothetical protein